MKWQRAVVVGASSGIGAAIAMQLAATGCHVALIARREAELKHIADEINAAGSPLASVYIHDVREYETVPALMQQIARDMGGIDLIVYSSGIMPAIAPDEYSFDKDRQMIEINLLGAIAWLNEAAQRFERAKAGTIIGISSVAGDRGRRGSPVYGTTKAALDTYLESLRNRLSRYGVQVVTVKPGPVATPMTADLDQKTLPLLITADKAAAAILGGAGRGKTLIYVPWLWQPIFLIIRAIPSFLFRKLNF